MHHPGAVTSHCKERGGKQSCDARSQSGYFYLLSRPGKNQLYRLTPGHTEVKSKVTVLMADTRHFLVIMNTGDPGQAGTLSVPGGAVLSSGPHSGLQKL